MLELVVERTPTGARAALLEDGRLVEVALADRDDPAPRGDVFLGRVRSIDRELNAAFVDYGLDRDGYLDRRDAGLGRGPIERRLAEGQSLVVQVEREAEADKAPRLTTDVALDGFFLTHRPVRPSIEPIGQTSGAEEVAALRARAAALFPDGGVVMRPAARHAGDGELMAELERLRALWAEIEARSKATSPPARLHRRKEPAVRLLMELAGPQVARIVAGDPATLAMMRRHLEVAAPTLADRLERQPGAFELSGTAEQLAAALEPEVPLDGGGRLIIQPTRAMVAIDVDGAGRRALDVNLEAAVEVARQLRLRRLGGTIVVDFVDLPGKRDRARLLAAARAAFAGDPQPVEILPLTPFGLMQIRRRRLGPSLVERLRRSREVARNGDREMGDERSEPRPSAARRHA
jgi:Rne/Rng family ribonuclease